MSHPAQRKFCKQVKKLYPQHFKRVNVIDVGSLDINGNNRYLFSKSYYVGVDVVAGKNVDVVGPAHTVLHTLKPQLVKQHVWNPDLKRIEPGSLFDTIISTEALEHDEHFCFTVYHSYTKLRPGGLLLITCAGDGRPEHGTAAHHPEASPGTNDYYANVSNDVFSTMLPPSFFTVYHLAQVGGDLQFYGIKK